VDTVTAPSAVCLAEVANRQSVCHACSMKSDVERKTAQALDLLSPTQIAAWCAGSLRMGDRIRSHPNPIKTNAKGRANTADTYEMVLHHELFYGLTERDPEKARLVVREMRWSHNPELVTLSHGLEERLEASA
jgi:hypothetical protein